jgi:hypothetical protein
MKKRDGLEPDMDELLKKTLRDDLPAEVQARMKRRLDQFRRSLEDRAQENQRPAWILRRPWVLLGRAALAAAAVTLIVLGFSLSGPGRRSILSDSVASYQKLAGISWEISAAPTMECQVQFSKGGKLQQEFRIQWLSPGRTLVRVIGSGGEITRELGLPPARRSVLEHIALPAEAREMREPQLSAELLPVEGLLSPSRLIGLLEGTWKPAGSERRGDCKLDSYSIFGPRFEPRSTVTVDGCTGLPARLAREISPDEKVEAVFRWGTGDPGPVKLSRVAGPTERTETVNS